MRYRVLTRELRGEVTGLDASEGMLEIARARMPDSTFVVGDALSLPFSDDRSTACSQGISTTICSRTSVSAS